MAPVAAKFAVAFLRSGWNGMKIRSSGFRQESLSQLLSWFIEEIVLLGSAFDGTGLDTAGTKRERVAGDPFQEQGMQRGEPARACLQPQVRH